MGDGLHRIWVAVDGEKFLVEVGDLNQRPITVTVEGTVYQVDPEGGEIKTGPLDSPSPAGAAMPAHPEGSFPVGKVCEVTAPMPGDILQVLVKEGQIVHPGDPLCVLDAMKMKNTIHAPQTGTITEILVEEGQSVEYGVVLFKFR
jgi:biotin carboxyl carrier protein